MASLMAFTPSSSSSSDSSSEAGLSYGMPALPLSDSDMDGARLPYTRSPGVP